MLHATEDAIIVAVCEELGLARAVVGGDGRGRRAGLARGLIGLLMREAGYSNLQIAAALGKSTSSVSDATQRVRRQIWNNASVVVWRDGKEVEVPVAELRDAARRRASAAPVEPVLPREREG